jgi:hypothetical protein
VNNFSELNAELSDEISELLKQGRGEEAAAIAADLRVNQQKVMEHGRRAQSIVHCAIDVQALGCDFFVFSGHKAFGPTFAHGFEFAQDTFHLVLFAFGVDVAYVVELRAVDVPERQVEKQVTAGKYAQIAFERVGPLRTHAFKVLNAGVEVDWCGHVAKKRIFG